MEDACAIGRRFVVPSLRYAFNELLEKESYSTWLVDRLIQMSSEMDSVSLNELRHSSRRQIKDAPQQLAIDNEILGIMEIWSNTDGCRSLHQTRAGTLGAGQLTRPLPPYTRTSARLSGR